MRSRLLDIFSRSFDGNVPDAIHFAPGRVNLIGEHVDYNDGLVAPLPLDLGTHVVVRRRPDGVIRLVSHDEEGEGRFDPAGEPETEPPGWTRYPMAMVRALRDDDRQVGGFDLAVAGDLIVGAGLSSSASLLVACGRALDELFDLGLTPLEIALTAHRAETRHVGVACGIMDQMACAVGKPDHVLLLDCRDQTVRHVPLDRERLGIVIIDSGTRRALADSHYNQRVAECQAALRVLQTHRPEIRSLRDATIDDLDRHGDEIDEIALHRARHVVGEIGRVLEFERALAHGDLAECGALLRASHESLARLYEASTDALDFLAHTASELPGVFGARLTGAGWGGCVIALTRRGAEQHLVEAIGPEYRDRFGKEAFCHILG